MCRSRQTITRVVLDRTVSCVVLDRTVSSAVLDRTVDIMQGNIVYPVAVAIVAALAYHFAGNQSARVAELEGQLAEIRSSQSSTEKKISDISSWKNGLADIRLDKIAQTQRQLAQLQKSVDSDSLKVEKHDLAISSLKERTSDIAAWKKALDRLTVEVERMRLTTDKVAELEREIWSLTKMDYDLKEKMGVFKQKVEDFMRTTPHRNVLWDAVSSIFDFITRPFRRPAENLLT